MLKGNTHRLPCSQFVNRCITSTAFIACTWIGCWSVSGQTTIQEKQTDSKVVTASHSEPVAMFSQPTTAPWELIGNQSGCFEVQFSRILNHPDIKTTWRPMIKAQLDSVLRSEPNEELSFKQFGLALDEITLLQGGLTVALNHNPTEPDGHRSSIDFGASKMEVTAANPVDWPGLINAFDFEKLYKHIASVSPAKAAIDLEEVQQAWAKSAQKSRANVFDANQLWNLHFNVGVRGKPTVTHNAIWEAVSGGAVTVIYDIRQQGEVPKNYKEQDPVNQANLEMTMATKTAAWGMDLTQDYKTCHIRFVAVPKEGVSTDDLLEKFESLVDACEQSTAADDFSLHFLEQLKKAKITIVKSKKSNGESTEAYLLVEGECSADLSKVIR